MEEELAPSRGRRRNGVPQAFRGFMAQRRHVSQVRST